MKKRIWSLGLITALFFTGNIYAQGSGVGCSGCGAATGGDDAFNFPSVAGFSSPTAASLTKVEQIPVDYYNGTASVSIPLHSFRYYKHSLPISLSYQSTGLRVQERASWVGLGWALNAGGVVTRTVNGMPDDHSSGKGYIQKASFLNNNVLDVNDKDDREILEKISDGDYDAEPDLFTVSAPTFSGEFAYINGALRFKSRQNVKIEVTYAGTYKFASFIMTDESGIKYTFAQQENTHVVSQSGSNPLPTQNYISAWYLTKIEHPQISYDVLLEYDITGYSSNQKTTAQGRRVYKSSSNPIACSDLSDDFFDSVTTTVNTAIYLKKIKGESPTGDFEVNFTLESRTDLGTEKRLKTIEIIENGETQKEIQFGYGYFGSGANTRLKLTSVQTYDKTGINALPGHEFEYYSGFIPAYDSKSMDYWGYYNATNNINLVPTAYSTGATGTGTPIYSSTTSRSPINSPVSMLKKIIYPTGGTTSFFYERNDYGYVRTIAEPATVAAGGMRIKSITNHDGVSTSNNIVKNISYGMDDGSGLSSGRIEGEPLIVETGNREYYDGSNNYTCEYYDIKPSSFYGIGHYTSNHLGYKKVTESIATANDYGKTIHNFEKHTYRNRGNLTSSKVYDNSTTPKLLQSSEIQNQYSYTTGTLSTGFQVEQKIYSTYYGGSTPVTVEDTVYSINSYGVYQSWDYVSSETSKAYNGQAGYVETGKTYTYSSSPNILLTKTTQTFEGASNLVTNYGYAHATYPLMNTAHMLSQLSSIQTSDGAGNGISKKWVIWDNAISGALSGVWYPKEQWVWNGTGTTTGLPTTSNAIKTSEITRYDLYGNPVEIQGVNGIKTSYDWSTIGTMPIGIFRNADSDDVFAHSFAYDGLDGWNPVDGGNNTGSAEFSVSENKLKMKAFGNISVGGERDYIGYDLGSEISTSIVWEFDVKIADSDHYDLQMSAGGSSWDFRSGGSSSEAAVWTAIKDEEWRVRNSSTWVTLKSGLIIGDTYNFKIVIHSNTNTADYYINGEELATNISFFYPSSGTQKIIFGHYGHSTLTSEWYIDNVRLYPADAQAQSAEIDPTLGTTLSMKDLTGATSRFEFDDFGRHLKTYNVNGELVKTNSYYYSLDGNTNYTTTDPNRVESQVHYDPANSSNVTKSVSYLDGLGREVQSQIRGGTKVITTETLYDKRGLPEIASRPIETTTTVAPGYYSSGLMGGGSFVPDENGEPLPGTALVHNYYAPIVAISNDEDFAYTQTKYEESPLARVEKSTLPGVSHQMGSGKEVITSYSLNTTETFATSAVNGIGAKTWAANSLTKTITEDSEGNKSISYTNGKGQTIASGVDMDSNDKLDRSTTDLVTEFAYDERGNMVLVEDPRGLQTTYRYNTLGQLYEKVLPDLENDIDYRYDNKGRLRFVKNANHKVSGSSLSHVFNGQDAYFNKTLNPTKAGILFFEVNISPQNGGFDGRIDDAANGYETLVSDFHGNDGGYEITVDKDILVQEGSYRFLGEMTISSDNLVGLTSGSFEFKPFTYSYTKYDDLDRPIEVGEYYGGTTFANADPNSSTFPTSSNQKLVEYKYDAGITYSDANNTKGKLAEVWSYDPNDLTATPSKTFYSYNNQGLVEWIARRITGLSGTFFVRYEYDELGRNTQVHYDSPNTGEDFYFWYTYDELGRVSTISSNENSNQSSAVQEAEYTYFADGQVKQLKLGPSGSPAQTVDYTYTVQGWVDMINNPSSMGTDKFATDLYYSDNGNIDRQRWEQANIGTSTYNFYYKYDAANRLTEACYHNSSCPIMGSYDAKFVYDKSGNLTSIDRYNNSGINFNDFGFTLTSNTNKLSLIYEDGDDYDVDYDPNGNLVQNAYSGIDNANYDWRNLSTWTVANNDALLFNYDGDGNRIKKEVVGGATTWYIRGADGQTIAAYNGSQLLYWVLPGGLGIINY